eukprot:TRINITY_DN9148_c0_g1_i1.p2 TRINITY_DN9148_c0_g1~~TRINITY_DN9148_c0_g1_i1.p2  ORF type:complete len:117 (-),score=11.86 TRINITY_DN9148_c0_g1_i1:45-395(-)
MSARLFGFGGKKTCSLIIGNSHKELRERKHEWTFFVQTKRPSDISMIKRVVVRIHPSFTPSVIKMRDPPFSLTKIGWGTFTIHGNVLFVDGTKFRYKHILSFEGYGASNELSLIHI